MSRRALVSAALFSLSLTACQLVAGIDGRHVEGTASGGSSGSAGSAGSGGVSSCGEANLPSKSTVRVGNLVSSDATVRFCFFPESGPATRIPRDECRDPLGFRQLAAPVALAPGKYTVSVVTSASPCDGPSLATISMELAEGEASTVLELGPSDTPSVAVFPESPPPTSGRTIRFVHAAPGVGALDLGITDAAGAPAKVTFTIAHGIDFGRAVAASDVVAGTVVDDHGYVGAIGIDLFLGAAPSGTDSAVLSTRVVATATKQHALSLYAVPSSDPYGEIVEPLLCDETAAANGVTPCDRGPASELSIDTLDIALAGITYAHAAERRPAILSAISSLTSDVVCLQQVWSDDDKAAIADAARATYPHALSFKLDESTQPDDPTAADGTVPTLPSSPPCASAEATSEMNALLDCLRDHCAVDEGQETSTIDDSACATGMCAAQFTPLFSVDPDARCLTCILIEMVGESFGEVRKDCTSLTSPVAFHGQSGLMMLSKRPISGDVAVFPGTWSRREAMRGRVALDNGAPLDVYCEFFLPLPGVALYNGVYGNGMTGSDGWRQEGLLQTRDLATYVTTHTGSGKAIVVGDFQSGPAIGDSIMEQQPEIFAALAGDYLEDLPSSYTPTCTLCADNPLVRGSTSSLPTHVFSRGLPRGAVTSIERTLDQPVVDAGSDGMIPLSLYYGLRARLSIRP